jgi:hypothetical protein
MKSPATLITVLLFSGLQAVPAAEEPAKVTFADDVFPILDNKCVSCHNTDEAKGGLDLASFGATMTGGSGGAIVVSADPKASRLYTLAAHTEEPVMPPKGTKATDEELKVIAAWITGGLLETKNSKAKKADKSKVDLNSITSTGKPEGPPAMPEHLILEPSVVTDRANAIPALAHSPWAPILAVAGQKQILLYHSADYDLLGVLPYPEGFPQTLSFSPNGAYLFCGGGRGGKSGNVVAWDIKTGERVIEVGKEFDIVLGADVSPDLKHAVMGGPGRVIKLWDTVAGEQISSVKKHTDWLLTAAYSPDGVIYATGDRNGGLYVWEAATGYEFYTLKGHTLAVTDLDWRMDGNVLASSSEDGSVMLWEMTNGTQIKKFDAHPGGVQGVDFAPDGTIATVGRDKSLKIWKGDGTAIRTIAASDDIVLSVAVSEDSKRVFTGDINGLIKGWDIATGTEIARVNPNPPPIDQQLAYSEKRIGELTGQLPKLEEGIKAASVELTAARTEQAEVDKRLAAATQSRDTQKGAIAKFDGAVKALTPEIEKLQQAATAKNAALKTITDALAATTTALKPQQDAATAASAGLSAKEAALQVATAALTAAQALAAKPALTPEQKTQHDALAAALDGATKARQAADQAAAARTAEQTTLATQLEEAKKLVAAAGPSATQAKAAADAAAAALGAATAEKQKADAALAAASANGQAPAPEVAAAAKAAADRLAAATAANTTAAATLATADANNRKAAEVMQQADTKVKAVAAALATAKTDQTARVAALAKADADFKPLRDAAAAGAETVKKAQTDLAAKTTASQQAGKARNDAKAAADQASALVAAANAKIADLKGKLTPAQTEATAAATALAAKQKELADSKTALAVAQAEHKKAEDLIVATTKQKEGAAAKVAAVVAKEAETKKSVEVAKAELQSSQFLQKKWQAAAINLTAMRETENLDDMAVKLDDMLVEETEAKKGVEQATLARTEAESTLATAKKTVETGTLSLQEKSASVLERALKLVASRAVAELREEAIQGQPASDVPSTADAPPATESSERKAEIGIVAAETLSYKTPAEITAEVTSLKTRLSDLEQFLANTYVEATKTKTTVLAADQVARETPQVIAERTKAEQQAALELTEAEAERKRQEQALVDQKKRIEELRAKYLATYPKRES